MNRYVHVDDIIMLIIIILRHLRIQDNNIKFYNF